MQQRQLSNRFLKIDQQQIGFNKFKKEKNLLTES